MVGERRTAQVAITGFVLNQFLTMKPHELKKCVGITSDAPSDMRLLALIRHDPTTDMWFFLCESQSFDPVPESHIAPPFSPTFTVHYEPEPKPALGTVAR